MTGTDFRWQFLPYCVERVAPGVFLICGRNYKPLGLCQHTFLPEAERNKYAVKLSMSARRARTIAWGPRGVRLDENGKVQQVWLYNDGCIPFLDRHLDTVAYLKRLTALVGGP